MSLANIRIVLMSPIYGGNVGSVCRAMKNMGLSQLVLAAPRPDLDEAEALRMASHAADVYRARREAATLEEAVGDCGLVVGTTARPGLYRQHAQTPRAWVPRVLEAAAAGPVAILFGREDRGLTNEELAICTQLVQIPTADAYTSLNLSQAVLVCAYELFVATDTFEPPREKSAEAPSEMRERMFGIWREALLSIGFMKPMMADHMMLGLRRIFARAPLTGDDVRILMGICRQTLWMSRQYREWKRKAGGTPEE